MLKVEAMEDDSLGGASASRGTNKSGHKRGLKNRSASTILKGVNLLGRTSSTDRSLRRRSAPAKGFPESEVVETDRADLECDEEGNTLQVNEYRILKTLGSGAFAEVKLARRITGDEEGKTTEAADSSPLDDLFALKVYNKSILKRKRDFKRVNGRMVMSTAFQKVEKEIAIMKKISHDNIISLYEVIDDPSADKLWMVLEYAPGGQVMEWNSSTEEYECRSRGCVDGLFPEEEAAKVLCDAVLGIDYLHANHIAHRDIKPENIFIYSEEDAYMIGDLGVAHWFEAEESLSKSKRGLIKATEGTYMFMAPEILQGLEYNAYAADIWSLGVTLYCMLFGRCPFWKSAKEGLEGLRQAVLTDPLVFPDRISSDCEDLLSKMLEKDPEKRIVIADLKDHPFVDLERSRSLRGKSISQPDKVEVSSSEIEQAITPFNNFAMMAMLKVRMASKLKSARASVSSRRTSSSSTGRSPSSPSGSIVSQESDTMEELVGSPALGAPSGNTAMQEMEQKRPFSSKSVSSLFPAKDSTEGEMKVMTTSIPEDKATSLRRGGARDATANRCGKSGPTKTCIVS